MSSKSDKSGVTTIVRIARPEPKWVAPSGTPEPKWVAPVSSAPERKWSFRPARPANAPFGPLTQEMAERPVVPEKPFSAPSGRIDAPRVVWVTE